MQLEETTSIFSLLMFTPESLSFTFIVELSFTVSLSCLSKLSLPEQLDKISDNIE